LFVLPETESKLIPISRRMKLGQLRSLVFMENYLFVAVSGSVMKLSLKNGLVFTAELSEQIGRPCVPISLVMINTKGKNVLLVCDFRQGCVHAFHV
jgi:hypothetical protein